MAHDLSYAPWLDTLDLAFPSLNAQQQTLSSGRYSLHEGMLGARDRPMVVPRLSLPTPSFLQAAIEAGPSPASPAPSMASSTGLPPHAFLNRSYSFQSQATADEPIDPLTPLSTVSAEELEELTSLPMSIASPLPQEPTLEVPIIDDAWSEAEAVSSTPEVVRRRGSGLSPRPSLGGHTVETYEWDDEQGTVTSWQVRINGISVGRRMDNNHINATKALNVIMAAREEESRKSRSSRSENGEEFSTPVHLMTRGKRDGILKAEEGRVVLKRGSVHTKGVWIPLERVMKIAEDWKSTDLFYPLFEDDIDDHVHRKPVASIPRALAAAAASRASSLSRRASTASSTGAAPSRMQHAPLPQAYQMASSASLSGSDYSTSSPSYSYGSVPTPQAVWRHPFDASAVFSPRLQAFKNAADPLTPPPASFDHEAAGFGRRASMPAFASQSLCSPPPQLLSFDVPKLCAPVAASMPTMLPISPRSYEFARPTATLNPLRQSSIYASPTSTRQGQGVPLAQPMPRRLAMDDVVDGSAWEDEFAPPAKRLRYE